jgi:AcrR family transcriptional regulator
MPQHVGMNSERHLRDGSKPRHHPAKGNCGHRGAALAHEDISCRFLFALETAQGAKFDAGQWMDGRHPILKSMDVQAAMDQIDLLPAQRAQFGCSQAVPEGHQIMVASKIGKRSSPASDFSTRLMICFRLTGLARSVSTRFSLNPACAKASLYSNFQSRVDLAVAFLDRREAVWTRGWLEAEIKRRASDPERRLLAIFDVFDGWFRKRTFEGGSFINVLLESKADSPVHHAAAVHLSKIRAIVRALANDADLREPEKFAQAWHMLMKGSIVSACEGNRNAAREAKCAAQFIIDGWPRERRR